ncbi:hypothetical protein [Frankia sp. AgKG'84/4]|uniref:hypothetical protein n=1 Tax=Frankia sp. AgKG'84/4 TaxID=573490 RepID=UPI00202A58CE|nr:hypothetical protein [Frankia sp. AgKG'84/4]MCL9797955.1 hypothetical protein [Frankia sp. AgKG'84/4]
MTVAVSFDHLIRLTDDIGLFEHALGSVRRRAARRGRCGAGCPVGASGPGRR